MAVGGGPQPAHWRWQLSIVLILSTWLAPSQCGTGPSKSTTIDPLTLRDPSHHIMMDRLYQTLPFDNPNGGHWKQGFPITLDSKETNREISVHVIPHSHNDPGWLMTFDEYFNRKTKGIISSIVKAAREKADRHFIWAEISFFSRWWREQSADVQAATIQLVERGQLEIVTGGWVMNDEATPHYFAIVGQLTEGHEWVQDNLHTKPVVGWSIDPFGHSPTQAHLYQLAGFDAMLIQRVHYAIKREFATKKTLEFFWQQQWNDSKAMFTHMMPFYSYDIPHSCGPDPSVCSLFEFTKKRTAWGGTIQPISEDILAPRSLALADQFRKKSTLYRTPTVLAPLGDDFFWTSDKDTADMLDNHEKVYKFIRSTPELHMDVKFSNLSSYFASTWTSAAKDSIRYPSVTGDFYTYADKDEDYWSGYYTSRSFYKALTRTTEATLRSADIAYALSGSTNENIFDTLQACRRVVSLFQHHDGVTGTSKTPVVNDYGQMLHNCRWDMKSVLQKSVGSILAKEGAVPTLEDSEVKILQDELPRFKVFEVPEGEAHVVVVFNSLSFARTEVVNVQVSSPQVKVRSSDGSAMEAQLNPIWDVSKSAFSEDRFHLYFLAYVPPLGFNTYFIEASTQVADTPEVIVRSSKMGSSKGPFPSIKFDSPSESSITNGVITVKANKEGALSSVMLQDGSTVDLKEQFMSYDSRDDGAYLFLPLADAAAETLQGSTVIQISGHLLSQLVILPVQPNPFQRRTLTLYNKADLRSQSIGVSAFVDLRGMKGNKQTVMRYSSNIQSQQQFYTDLNGFQMQHRKIRPDKSIQHNFYPSTTSISLQDQNRRLTLHTKQSMAAASLADGSLELMLDRRVQKDDFRGLGQGVTDNVPTIVDFSILLETKPIQNERLTVNSQANSLQLNHPLHTLHSSSQRAEGAWKWTQQYISHWSGLSHDLPPWLHVLALKKRRQDSQEVLLQVVHQGNEAVGIQNVNMLNFFACSLSALTAHSLTFLHYKENLVNRGTAVPFAPFQIRAFVATIPSGTPCIGQGQQLELPKEKVVSNQPNHVAVDGGQNPPLRDDREFQQLNDKLEEVMGSMAELQKQMQDIKKDLSGERRSAGTNSGLYYYALLMAAILAALAFAGRGRKSILFILFLVVVTTLLPMLFFPMQTPSNGLN